MTDAALDPWRVAELGGARFLFGFATRHTGTGGQAWTRSSPLVSLDAEGGTATTLSGRRYILGARLDPSALPFEGLVAWRLLVEGERGAEGAYARAWLAAQKWARWLSLEPPAFEDPEGVEAFLRQHDDDYAAARFAPRH